MSESERDLTVWTTRALEDAIAAAESRGYERGIEDAAGVADKFSTYDMQAWDNKTIAAAIRSLKAKS